MPNKLTHEFIEAEFAKAGYTLLEEYKNSKAPIKFRCDKGHIHLMSWATFRKGSRCAYCSPQIVQHSFVKSAFENEGYTLLSKYINATSKLNAICPEGHYCSIRWSDFNRGSRCSTCRNESRKLTHEFVEKKFVEAGYTLLSEYVDSNRKLKFRCNQGHYHHIAWSKFQSGRRCAYCSGNLVDPSEVKAAFESEGYRLLSECKMATKKIDFICPQGHKHKITWGKFKQGKRCVYCAHNSPVKHSDVQSAFAKAGYKMLSQYSKSNVPIDFICPNGHRHKMTWNSFQRGSRCAYCPKTSFGGFRPGEPATLYYLKIKHKGRLFYKIGITNQSVEQRYIKESFHYKILMEKQFLFGSMARDEEKKILEKHKTYRYKGPKIFKKKGSTELFTKDVLKLDKSKTSNSTNLL